jgi:hypothetical protein
MTRLRPFVLMLLSLAAIGASAGCGDDATSVSPTPTGATSFTQVFSDTLAPGASSSFAFALSTSTPVRISLSSLTDANENPLSATLTLIFGRPAGTGCGALHSVNVQAALATHLHVLPSQGTYCAAIRDAGQLATTATFGIRITQGEPSSAATPGTDTYSSVLFPGGFTSRSFEASTAGVATVVLDSISDPAVPSLNIGIGFPRIDGGGCQLTTTFVGTRGAQRSLPVEIGTYCVKVSDPGTLTALTSFSLRIIRP